MTRANRASTLFLVLCCAVQVLPRYSTTAEITSNDMWGIAGSGDTVWVTTSRGVNFTTSMLSSPILWQGFRDAYALSLSYGAGKTLLSIAPDDQGANTNTLLLYTHATAQQKNITFSFPTNQAVALGGDSVLADFRLFGSAWSAGHFWIAASQAGLLRVDENGNAPVVFYPGDSASAYLPAQITTTNIPAFPDTSRFAFSVAVEDPADTLTNVWLLCSQSLWVFDQHDTTWTQINDSALGPIEYADVRVKGEGNTAQAFVIAVIEGTSESDTALFVYDRQTDDWKRFTSASKVVDVEFGAEDRVYVIHGNRLNLYRDTLAFDALPHLSQNAEINGNVFYNLMRGDIEIDPDIRDIHYSATATDTLMWVTSSEGLFFSDNVHFNELENTSFQFISRKIPLAAGLEKVYAYPSILIDDGGGGNSEVTFAYNLSKDDHVTIDIYDWNMDHVVRIIDDEFRFAGVNTATGRSAIAGKDVWNGTAGGKTVAPGVYYFRITSRKEGRAFGKIIVAKSQM